MREKRERRERETEKEGGREKRGREREREGGREREREGERERGREREKNVHSVRVLMSVPPTVRPTGEVESDPSATRREVLPHLLPAPGWRLPGPSRLVDYVMMT